MKELVSSEFRILLNRQTKIKLEMEARFITFLTVCQLLSRSFAFTWKGCYQLFVKMARVDILYLYIIRHLRVTYATPLRL